ncbi:MAG: outer membrane protein transport protein [Planctomycetes bacterium]|nr:outer membrane protein transport protein [Planctomycetota bacterium]
MSLPAGGDGFGMFRMPSGMAWSLDHRVDLHVFAFQGNTRMRNPLNDYTKEGSSVAGSFGFVFAPGRVPVDSDAELPEVSKGALQRFTFGFGIYPDMGGGGATDVRYTTFPQTVEVERTITFVTGALNVSYRPTEWLAFGLGLHAIYSAIDTRTLVGGSSTPLNGSPTINGVAIPGNPSYADFLNLFASDGATDPTTLFETNLSSVQFGAIVSLSLRPTDWFAVGFSYRPRSWDPIGFDGDATIDATATFAEALSGLDPVLRDLFLATLPNAGTQGFVSNYKVKLRGLRVPRQIRLSMSARPHDRVLLGLELAWTEWHRAFKQSVVELSNGSNGDLNFVVGSSSIHSVTKTRWRSNWTLSLYAAVAATDDLTLRLGCALQRNPSNANTNGGAPSGALTGSMVSFGAGYWIGNFELSGLVEHGFHASAHGRKDPGLTASQSYYSSKQWFLHFGVSYVF